MFNLTLPFIISQVAITIATGLDFLGWQYKKREHTILCLIVSGILMVAHYFLLGKIAAGVIVSISVLRFVTCYFTTNKKYLFIFIALNTISLFFTYKEATELLIYVGVTILMVGNFQEDNKLMRKLMMVGTPFFIVYDFIIFSPMAVVADVTLLISGFVGYYRHYVKNNEKIK
ncbi:MAG: YgjV family protein [bacterium]|nr:YgjV family protein [bacterium]